MANLTQLDEKSINITSTSLRSALSLTHADRRWIDFLHQKVAMTWDPSDPSRPTNHGYVGSEEFIRLQFEEYLLALLSATKYHLYLYSIPYHKRELSAFPDIEGDPAVDFSEVWLDAWKTTANYKLWLRYTDSHLFDIVDPRHPTAGSLSIEDINRRLAAQIDELHLEERFATSRDTLNKHLASGKKQVSTTITNLWADFESFRAAQRAKAAENRAASPPGSLNSSVHIHNFHSILSPPATAPLSKSTSTSALPSPSQYELGSSVTTSQTSSVQTTPTSAMARFETSHLRARAPDLSHAQAAVGAAGQKASAYFSSWGAWASERRKGWNARSHDGTEDAGISSSGGGIKAGGNPPVMGRLDMSNSGVAEEKDEPPRSAPAVVPSGFEEKRRQENERRIASPTTSRELKPEESRSTSSSFTEKLNALRQAGVRADSNTGHTGRFSASDNFEDAIDERPAKTESDSRPTSPRSPMKRGVEKWRGRRREERGSDGIGRLDA